MYVNINIIDSPSISMHTQVQFDVWKKRIIIIVEGMELVDNDNHGFSDQNMTNTNCQNWLLITNYSMEWVNNQYQQLRFELDCLLCFV